VPTEQIERGHRGGARVDAQADRAAEGIAVLAPQVLLEGDGGATLAAVMHKAGIELDLAHALAVERALEPCRWAEVNAALMLHERGMSEGETQAYLERWR
jgi:hypothetical protein